jgi:hypothetical protein
MNDLKDVIFKNKNFLAATILLFGSIMIIPVYHYLMVFNDLNILTNGIMYRLSAVNIAAICITSLWLMVVEGFFLLIEK